MAIDISLEKLLKSQNVLPPKGGFYLLQVSRET